MQVIQNNSAQWSTVPTVCIKFLFSFAYNCLVALERRERTFLQKTAGEQKTGVNHYELSFTSAIWSLTVSVKVPARYKEEWTGLKYLITSKQSLGQFLSKLCLVNMFCVGLLLKKFQTFWLDQNAVACLASAIWNRESLILCHLCWLQNWTSV